MMIEPVAGGKYFKDLNSKPEDMTCHEGQNDANQDSSRFITSTLKMPLALDETVIGPDYSVRWLDGKCRGRFRQCRWRF